MAAESDEEIARQLQAEFDAEATQHQQQMMDDRRLAASVAKTHDISDSESDSDATIEPPDYSGSLDGSQDLFDTTSGSASLNRSRKSVSSSPRANRAKQKPLTEKPLTVSKILSLSKTHEVSDSDSDSVEDRNDSKSLVKPKKHSVAGGSSHSVGSKPKKHSVAGGSSHSVGSKPKKHSVAGGSSHSVGSKPKKHSVAGGSSHSVGSKQTSSRTFSASWTTSNDRGDRVGAGSSKNHSIPKQNASSSDDSKKHSIPKISPSSSEDSKKYSVPKLSPSSSEDSKKYSIPKLSPSSSGSAQSRGEGGAGSKPTKHGDRNFRTNPVHFQDFKIEGEKNLKRKSSPLPETDLKTEEKKQRTDRGAMKSQHQKREREKTRGFDKTIVDVFSEFQPLSLFLTKVRGIDDRFNSTGAVSIKDILSPLMGNLQASCQFNFMVDIPWLVEQYPKQFRDKPLLLVHGEKERSETQLKADGIPYPHISFCRAKLEMMYGTHHTKMMLLLYDCGMRVVIHTANLISGDWDQKTQGVWISPVFPRLPEGEKASSSSSSSSSSPSSKALPGDSPTKFKRDLLAYMAAYNVVPLLPWERHVREHDFSAARAYIIGSVPGRHTGERKAAWGHLKLRKVLQEAGPDKKEMSSWPVIGQFSSIGSLGATPDQWLCDEWLGSLSQCQGVTPTPLHHSKLQLVYPSKENVRLCLEGYGGGGCLPYSIKTAKKQIYLNNFVRKWGSEGRGRTVAIPHMKTYTRVSPDYTRAAWFLVTSANLSKAAWGMLEKQKTQLMIRSYEIGVLFLPSHVGCDGSFPVAKTAEEVVDSDEVMLPFPYDLPPPTYQKGDRIWMWDVPCVDLPDIHGKKYCPRL